MQDPWVSREPVPSFHWSQWDALLWLCWKFGKVLSQGCPDPGCTLTLCSLLQGKLRCRTRDCWCRDRALAACTSGRGDTCRGRKGWGKLCSRCRNKTHLPAAKPQSPDLTNTLLASPWLCSANSCVSSCCFIWPHSLTVVYGINLQRLGLSSQGGGTGHFPGISSHLWDWLVAPRCQRRLSSTSRTGGRQEPNSSWGKRHCPRKRHSPWGHFCGIHWPIAVTNVVG